jgi:MFS family permease
MKERLSACLGIFSVMALSNAIVPVLPAYAAGSVMQGGIYAAYFLGAFFITLPAGLISDRYGRVAVMQAGLLVTIASGVLLFIESEPLVLIALRLFEGIGAGLFVAASMAFVNTLPDHERMSGYLMASLNAGLVLGLIVGGYLAQHTSVPAAGIAFFTIISFLPAVLSAVLTEHKKTDAGKEIWSTIITLVTDLRWFWYSALVLIGITGVIISLYPEFSDAAPDQAGIWIASMSVATVLSVLVVSRLNLPPVSTIRVTALLMAAGVILTYYTPAGFVLIGALAGIVMISQMAFLAQVSDQQGAAMGLFSTTSYLGMSLFPFMAGFIAETTTFFLAFFVMALAAITVSLTIGRCTCLISPEGAPLRATEKE